MVGCVEKRVNNNKCHLCECIVANLLRIFIIALSQYLIPYIKMMWHWAREWFRYIHITQNDKEKRERKNEHALAFILVVSVSLFVRIVSFLSVCDRLLIRCMHVNVCRQALAFVLLLHRYETIRITLKLQIWITYLDRTCKRKKRRILRKTMGEFLKISIVIVSVFEENATNSCFSPSLSEYFKISK